jgi:hypothetical protein
MEFIEICLILAGVLLLALAAKGEKKPPDNTDTRFPGPPLSDTSYENSVKLQRALTELVNELHTLSRDVTLDMEQKLLELKELLQLADTKLEEISLKEAGYRHTDRAPERDADNEAGTSPHSHEPQSGSNGVEASSSSSNRYQQIYDLADEGLPINDIARNMHMGKGEIQLILSLRGKGSS